MSTVVTSVILISIISYTNPIKQNISALNCYDENCRSLKNHCEALSEALSGPISPNDLDKLIHNLPYANFSKTAALEPKCAIFVDDNETNTNNTITLKYLSTNPDLNITSTNGFPNGNYYNLVGEVYNNGQIQAKFVEIIATFYDKDNKIIGTENTFTTPITIHPSSSAPFKLNIGSSDVTDINLIKTIKLVVDSN